MEYAKVQEHRYENMIVLCAICHGRKTRGEIDRKSLLIYKANLAVINSRYSDIERRFLEVVADQRRQLELTLSPQPRPDWPRGIAIALPGTLRMMMLYLVRDGLVELVPSGTELDQTLNGLTGVVAAGPQNTELVPETDYYRLTLAGVDFVDAWMGARPVDVDDGPGNQMESGGW